MLDEIKISNQEFLMLWKNRYNINERNSFWYQDRLLNILLRIYYLGNAKKLFKLDGHQNNVYSQIQELGKPVDGEFPLCWPNDAILELKGKIYDIEEEWATDKQKEIDEINKSIRKEYLKKMSGNKKNDDVVGVLDKLVENNFNFWELDWKEQSIFANKFIEKHFEVTMIFYRVWMWIIMIIKIFKRTFWFWETKTWVKNYSCRW